MMPRQLRRLGAGRTELTPRRTDVSRYILEKHDTAPLEEGEYRLRVSLDESALPPVARQLRNILSRDLLFEVREARAPTELADLYLRHAYRDQAAGRTQESRQWAEKALSVWPNSLAAMSDLAVGYLAEGNCAAGRPLMEKVIASATTGSDPLFRMSQENRLKWAHSLNTRLMRQCPR